MNDHDLPRLEAGLAERKNHIRGLFADGKIDQAGFLLLEKRIDELGRNRRLATVDETMRFLPVSLFDALRETLADGRVTDWEHRHFVEALRHDKVLSAQQRLVVRKPIDDWLERDKRAA